MLLILKKTNWNNIFIFVGSVVLTAFALSGLMYFTNHQAWPERVIGWKEIYRWQAIIYGWAILFPFIRYLARRLRFDRSNWPLILLVHLLAALVFLVVHAGIYILMHRLAEPTLFETHSYFYLVWRIVVTSWLLDLAVYGFILSVIYTRDYYRRLQKEQVKSSELKAQLATAQLQALKMQLHPHFLFNTLNSISTLIHEDSRAADQMVVRLGDFLRRTLENSGELEVPLAKELDFINCYLEIESIRFQDRLSIKKEIEPETLQARVPNLILQPIIENAIRHGISRQPGAGRITIRARRSSGSLLLQIEDNGPGIGPQNVSGSAAPGGIGLVNTRARLCRFYGDDYRLEYENAVPHGLIVTIEIPLQPTADKPGLRIHEPATT